jgi:hypothetical protein
MSPSSRALVNAPSPGHANAVLAQTTGGIITSNSKNIRRLNLLYCNPMHPLVRDLYKRALVVGRDYPLGLDYIRRTWKTALRDQRNCPSCYCSERTAAKPSVGLDAPGCEKELRKAVARGRFMVREMIGVIQLRKYRTMKRRYDVSHTRTTLPDYARLLTPGTTRN